MHFFNLHGLTRLHTLHFIFALICILDCLPTSEFLKPYEYTPYPPGFTLMVDYARVQHIAPAVFTLEVIVAFVFVVTIIVDQFRRKGLPMLLELSVVILCLAVQIASLVLTFSAKPVHLDGLQGGSTGGVIGSDGKLGALDAAATLSVQWDLMAMFSLASLIFLTVHIVYQVVVGLRHRRIRPRVFVESVPGDLAWNLNPVESLDEAKKTDLYPFEGVGSARAKEWIETGMRPPGL